MHLSRQSIEETDVSDSSDAEDRERLGDKVFSLVEELDPLHANDITGELTLNRYAESSLNECLRLLPHIHVCRDATGDGPYCSATADLRP